VRLYFSESFRFVLPVYNLRTPEMMQSNGIAQLKNIFFIYKLKMIKNS